MTTLKDKIRDELENYTLFNGLSSEEVAEEIIEIVKKHLEHIIG